MKIQDIERMVEEAAEKLHNMIKARDEAAQRAEKCLTEAEDAAIAGDTERYKKLKSQADDAAATNYVCTKQIERMKSGPVVTKDEVVDAWTDYAKEYNKTLKAKLKKFHDMKMSMLKEYAEMVDLQGEACAVRERLAEQAGIKIDGARRGNSLDKIFQMEFIPCAGRTMAEKTMSGIGQLSIRGTSRVEDADAVYFLSSLSLPETKLCDSPEEAKITSVVVWHEA